MVTREQVFEIVSTVFAKEAKIFKFGEPAPDLLAFDQVPKEIMSLERWLVTAEKINAKLPVACKLDLVAVNEMHSEPLFALVSKVFLECSS